MFKIAPMRIDHSQWLRFQHENYLFFDLYLNIFWIGMHIFWFMWIKIHYVGFKSIQTLYKNIKYLLKYIKSNIFFLFFFIFFYEKKTWKFPGIVKCHYPS